MDLATVYSRELEGQTLTLAPSGWTYRRTFVLYDKETETLWYPIPGTKGLTGISGLLADRFLPELEYMRSSWSDWRRDNPDTKHMKYERRFWR